MTSTIPATQPLIKTKSARISETLTLNSDGYLTISSYKPADIQHLLFAAVLTWSAMYPKAAFTVTSDGSYLLGTAGMQIQGLAITYYYID